MRISSKTIKLIPVLIVSTLLMQACVTTFSGPREVAKSKISFSAKQVVVAIRSRLYSVNAQAVDKELGITGSAKINVPSNFAIEGFITTRVVFDEYTPPAEGTSVHRMTGFIQMEDWVARSAQAYFDVSYKADQLARSEIIDASIVMLTPPKPAVVTLIVPAAAMNGFTSNSYTDLYGHAIENAIEMGNPSSIPAREDDYSIFVFVNDRLGPDATIKILLAESESGSEGDVSKTQYIADGGWVAGVINVRMALSASDERFVKTIYTPGMNAAADARQPRVISTVTTAPYKK